jgi:hypothetical protein
MVEGSRDKIGNSPSLWNSVRAERATSKSGERGSTDAAGPGFGTPAKVYGPLIANAIAGVAEMLFVFVSGLAVTLSSHSVLSWLEDRKTTK